MSDLGVIVYTQTHCSSCKQVERLLEEQGCEFTVRDVFEDAEALDEITSRGFMSTPVTRIGEEWIAGYRPSRLKRVLAALLRSEALRRFVEARSDPGSTPD